MKYQTIDSTKSEQIAMLAVCLTNEITERTGTKHFSVDVPLAIDLCKNYVSNGIYQVMAAFDADQIVGFASVCQSYSLYAEGQFGIIQEFYVMPEYRSKGIGQELLQSVVKLAKQQGWKRLELCTPPLPQYKGTVEFYKSNGFEVTGGHKMKHVIA
ncbi:MULTISPECIES: GNAT family N-acetyltransferase [Pseudoalteromonas]|uniref:GNAT family N-acetyltransferase n=1 Tax=Pseudoalteromonas amylolytica TaxID=1859457 RepID=A0A1S1MYH0_9GAMM|nr:MULTISPECIES: GNAT family N-acetyltransferase [Pseudoalteromonas]OHU87774.1 GNAT family N-acetyltransferase [Pseudoalteromonas sp. JW3]OHU91214.1 GNAT family N-acetyltransferase [Pseudoalteromonas amylolytica]